MRPAFESDVFQNYGSLNSRQPLDENLARRTLDQIIQKDRDSSFLESFEQRHGFKKSPFISNELDRNKPHAATINVNVLQSST